MTLFLDILLNCVPIGTLASCGSIIAICPELSSPKLSFHLGFPSDYFSGSDALEDLQNSAGCCHRMSTAEQVNIVSVGVDCLPFDGVPFSDALGSLYNYSVYYVV